MIEIEKREHENNQKLLEENPEQYATYPDIPNVRFLVTPALMHQMIFKAFEDWQGMDMYRRLGFPTNKESFNWADVPGQPMAKVKKLTTQESVMIE